jgi:hypothetical protein
MVSPEFARPRNSQIEAVGKLHDRDLAEGYDGVYLDDAV